MINNSAAINADAYWVSVFLFFQLMTHLGVVENEIVLVRSTSLPTATFIKLQPHTKDFLNVSYPREL
jgi:hypothetical protein